LIVIVTWNKLLRTNLMCSTTTKVIVHELPPGYRDGWTVLYRITGIRDLVIFLAKAPNVFSLPPSRIGLACPVPRTVEISSNED